MSYSRWIFLVFLISVSAMSIAGDVQVSCEPGLSIYVDGELAGTSSAKEDGLFLMDVDNGKHSIRVKKEGFVPQTFEVEVSSLPIEITVAEFVPIPILSQQEARPAPAPDVKRLVGHLVVTSAPQNCVVEIDGEEQIKDTPYLTIGGLAAGKHTISFTKAGYEQISGVVDILPGAEVKIRGNFKEGEFEILYEGKGSLRVTSEPTRCSVFFWEKTREKTRLKLNVSHIPAGEHPMIVTIPGRKLSKKIMIMDGQRTKVHVSFMKGDDDFVVTYEPE